MRMMTATDRRAQAEACDPCRDLGGVLSPVHSTHWIHVDDIGARCLNVCEDCDRFVTYVMAFQPTGAEG